MGLRCDHIKQGRAITVTGKSQNIESQHSNRGVENPSQVCKTEEGIAWVNKFGVFLSLEVSLPNALQSFLQLV